MLKKNWNRKGFYRELGFDYVSLGMQAWTRSE